MGNVKNWVRTIMDSIIFIGVLLTSFFVVCKQRNYNPPILIQLTLLIVCYIGFELRDWYKTLSYDTRFNNNGMPNWIWFPFSLSQVLFLAQHWVFTAQYLKVALLFELAFCVKT